MSHTWRYLESECLALGKDQVEPIAFFLEDRCGCFLLPLIRRPIPIPEYSNYYDLTSPYSYSGVLGAKLPVEHYHFLQQLRIYLRELRYVTLFLRIAPYNWGPKNEQSVLPESFYVGKTVIIDLTEGMEGIPFLPSSYRTRRDIRREVRRGFDLQKSRLDKDTADIFFKDYQSSMAEKKISGYYAFSRDYFDSLDKISGFKFYYYSVSDKVGHRRASAIVVGDATQTILEYFLAARKGFDHSFGHVLIDYIAKDAFDNGYKYFHLGGGAESLMFFKSGFSKIRLNYFVEKIVLNDSVYQGLPEISNQFPTYRSETK